MTTNTINRDHSPPGRAFAAHDDLAPFMREVAARRDVHEFDAAMINLAWEVARHAVDVDLDEKKALLVLVLASMLEQKQGSTRLPLDTASLTGRFAEVVGEDRAHAMVERVASLATSPLPDLIGSPGDYRPLIVDGGALYQHRMHHRELRLVDRLGARLRRGPSERDGQVVSSALADVLERMPVLPSGELMQLNAEQQYALLTALHQPFSMISGGPGTGKTTILVSLARLAVRLGVPAESIALAAPTGKAANRIGVAFARQLAAIDELTDDDERLRDEMPNPRTLHRLLGYSPTRERFHHHRNNPVEAELVIVDEASMIDLFVMERLIDATPPEATLVLVGDSDQLPSVNSGAVFRDLMPKAADTDNAWRTLAESPVEASSSSELCASHAVRLQRSYRMDAAESGGAQILRLARGVKNNDVSDLLDATPAVALEALGRDDGGVAIVESASAREVATSWYAQTLSSREGFVRDVSKPLDFDGDSFSVEAQNRLESLFAHYSCAQLLTLTRVGPTGSRRVNEICHAQHVQHMRFSPTDAFVTGDPVMMQQNDYQRGLFNGDHGLVLTVHSHADDPNRGGIEPMVVFQRGDRFVPFTIAGLRAQLDLAYAITVHKSQGSEFEHVGLLLPDEPMPLLTRELLYTGLTRASETVTIFGDPDLIKLGAARGLSRHSGLSERLARAIQ
jgi:exodeoxyribonuclease V alpha subunit